MKFLKDFTEEERKNIYRDVAKNWNREDKEVIAARYETNTASISRIAFMVERLTGMKMRKQLRTKNVAKFAPEFIQELKQIHTL